VLLLLQLAPEEWNDDDAAGDRAGVWEQSSGTLKVILQQTLKPATSTVRLTFLLRQPAAPQDARVPKAVMIGMLPQDLSGSVLGASGVAAVAGFSVHESGRVVGEENQLTFRFVANVPIMQGVELTLTGLAGRLEACEGVTTVAAPFVQTLPAVEIQFDGIDQAILSNLNTASLYGNGTAGLCASDDSHVLLSMPFSAVAGQEIVFSFYVKNWVGTLAGASPALSASGCIAPMTLSGSVTGECDATQTMSLAPFSASQKILQSGFPPKIERVVISENTPVIAQQNIVYLEMIFSFRLKVRAQLVLDGLRSEEQNSETPDSDQLAVSGTHAGTFGGSGVWRQMQGRLTLTAAQEVRALEVIRIQFSLANARFQSKARCALGENFCAEGGQWEGQYCPVVGAQCGGVCKGGKNYCNEPVVGDCTQFTLPDEQDAADMKCPGGQCLTPNQGAPLTTLLNVVRRFQEVLVAIRRQI